MPAKRWVFLEIILLETIFLPASFGGIILIESRNRSDGAPYLSTGPRVVGCGGAKNGVVVRKPPHHLSKPLVGRQFPVLQDGNVAAQGVPRSAIKALSGQPCPHRRGSEPGRQDKGEAREKRPSLPAGQQEFPVTLCLRH